METETRNLIETPDKSSTNLVDSNETSTNLIENQESQTNLVENDEELSNSKKNSEETEEQVITIKNEEQGFSTIFGLRYPYELYLKPSYGYIKCRRTQKVF